MELVKAAPFNLQVERAALRAFKEEHRDKLVGVVCGPKSREDAYYISRVPRDQLGVTFVLAALARLGFRSMEIDPTRSDFIEAIRSVDYCFLGMHGEYGEDGRVQGLLDFLGRPYIGSGVQANAVGLNKVLTKHVMNGLGLRTPRFASLASCDSARALLSSTKHLPLPLIAKEVCGGSSIGTKILQTQAAVAAFLSEQREQAYFVEEFVEGRALTVGVLELDQSVVATPLMETRYDAPFYDEDTKREESAVYDLPARVEPAQEHEIQAAALRLHHGIGCRGFSRVDFILEPSGGIHALEINTVPGMSAKGNFPVMVQALGLTYDETVLAMLRSCLWTKQ